MAYAKGLGTIGCQMEETKPSLWQTIARVCKDHPLVGPLGVLGAIASIVAIPLAVVLWLWPTVPKRQLTYAIQPVRTSLLQVNSKSDIAVTYKGKPIDGDLTAAQIMIANAGDLAIDETDMLSPLVLVISNASYVETSLSVPAREGTLFHTKAIDTNAVKLAWKTLERNDNPVFQVVYCGKRDAAIMLYGRIKGQDAITQAPWPSVAKSRGDRERKILAGALLCLFLVLVTLVKMRWNSWMRIEWFKAAVMFGAGL